MVEFALVLPILLMIVTGITSFGLVFYRYVTLTDAVRVGARTLALQRGNADPCTSTANQTVASAVDVGLTNSQLTFSYNGTPFYASSTLLRLGHRLESGRQRDRPGLDPVQPQHLRRGHRPQRHAHGARDGRGRVSRNLRHEGGQILPMTALMMVVAVRLRGDGDRHRPCLDRAAPAPERRGCDRSRDRAEHAEQLRRLVPGRGGIRIGATCGRLSPTPPAFGFSGVNGGANALFGYGVTPNAPTVQFECTSGCARLHRTAAHGGHQHRGYEHTPCHPGTSRDFADSDRDRLQRGHRQGDREREDDVRGHTTVRLPELHGQRHLRGVGARRRDETARRRRRRRLDGVDEQRMRRHRAGHQRHGGQDRLREGGRPHAPERALALRPRTDRPASARHRSTRRAS